MAGIPTFL
jgi:hypothetical protein